MLAALIPVATDSTAATLRGTLTGGADHAAIVLQRLAGEPGGQRAEPMPAPKASRASTIGRSIVQRDMRFLPPVLVVPPGTTVDFPNAEAAIYHNVYLLSGDDPADLGTYKAGTTSSIRLDEPAVFEVFCSIHVRMYAVIVVDPSPFAATVSRAGSFVIEGIPAGMYRVQIVRLHMRALEFEEESFVVDLDGDEEHELDL